MTVADLIYAAYRIAGILAQAGRGYSNSQRDDGLKTLNSMIDAWKADRLMVYAELRSVFDLQANVQTYSIGESAADFDIERPEKIAKAGLVWPDTSPELETPLEILTDEMWAATRLKAMTSTQPTAIHYRPALPNGVITLWPLPTLAAKIAIYTGQTVNQFATAADPVVLAPAYQEAIEYNLADRLAMRFPESQKMSARAIETAKLAYQKIRTINTPSLMMQTESAAQGTAQRGRWNPYTNSYD